MPTKYSVFNAGLKASSLVGAYIRTIVGALVAALVWLGLGWALSSWTLGFILAAWSLLVGPALLPLVIWRSMRMRKRLFLLRFERYSEVAHSFFRSLLRKPGAHPLIYVRPARDMSFFWMETSFFSIRSRQVLVLTTAWLQQSPAQQARDWEAIWDSIARLSVFHRRLKTLQFLFWIGALSPLEPLFYVARLVLDVLGFRDLPRPAFWVQRVCWDLRRLWFGTIALPASPEEMPPSLPGEMFRLPDAWNSLSLGVWFQLPLRRAHPLWPVLTHSDAFVDIGEAR
jgi:hypothetical protein